MHPFHSLLQYYWAAQGNASFKVFSFPDVMLLLLFLQKTAILDAEPSENMQVCLRGFLGAGGEGGTLQEGGF